MVLWCYGVMLIVVNCCAACRAAMCVGYMKSLLSLTIVPFDVHFQLGYTLQSVPNYLVCFMLSLTELHLTKNSHIYTQQQKCRLC